MAFRKFLSPLSIVGAVVLMFGLGISVVGLQHPQDDRSHASYTRDSVPSPVKTERSSQSSLGPCWHEPQSGDLAGAMCESDGGTQSGSVSDASAAVVCPGGFVGGNARNGATGPNTWYCPNGNNYRCCMDAAPAVDLATVNDTSSVSIAAGDTITLKATGHDPDSAANNPDNNQYGGNENWRRTVGFFWEKNDSNPAVTFSQTGEILDNPATVSVSGFQTGKTYKFHVRAYDGYKYSAYSSDVTVTVGAAGCTKDSDCTAPKICDIATKQCVDPGSTRLNLTLFLHGLGKGGDNVTDHDPNHAQNAVNGTTNLQHNPRAVTVQVLNPLDNSVVASKDTSATYNATPGNFTISDLDMGTTLSGQYIIQVVSQSLRGRTPNNVTLSAGSNTIPVMRLVNGDADRDGIEEGKININDYTLIVGCIDPFGQGPADCPGDNAAKADINDDGKVDEFDMSLLIRELSIQSL